jgi:hypothetical protein
MGARALARGSHLDCHEQRNDYTKEPPPGKWDINCEYWDGYRAKACGQMDKGRSNPAVPALVPV